MEQQFEDYRLHCNDCIAKQVASLLMCSCEACSKVPSELRYETIGQSLVDIVALHIFAKTKANVDLGQDSMVEARNKARTLLDRLFTEFGMGEGESKNDGSHTPQGG